MSLGLQANPHYQQFENTTLFYYALLLALDLLATLIAFLLERKEDWRLLIWLFLQRFSYRQLMYYVAVKSTLTAIRGTVVGWGKLERKATVSVSGHACVTSGHCVSPFSLLL
jgi:hypothetical protein